MKYLGAEEKIRALRELQNHIIHHHRWSLDLNRTLICGTPPEDDTLEKNAHCLCKLGQWLLGNGKHYFEKHPNFPKIVSCHKEMHDLARELATYALNGEKISETKYDLFQESLELLRELIHGTHKELYDEIVQTDPLTGAMTRLAMHEALEMRISSSTPELETSWLVMMDIDHFKTINDTYGHSMGDQVLVGIAATVQSQIRASDLFYRYGGEEFLLCICDVDRSGIYDIAERIRSSIEQKKFKTADGSLVSVTSSFGIAGLRPHLEVINALDRADFALYQAKKAGRNRVRIYSRRPLEQFQLISN